MAFKTPAGDHQEVQCEAVTREWEEELVHEGLFELREQIAQVRQFALELPSFSLILP
jgi:hypothetical protein